MICCRGSRSKLHKTADDAAAGSENSALPQHPFGFLTNSLAIQDIQFRHVSDDLLPESANKWEEANR